MKILSEEMIKIAGAAEWRVDNTTANKRDAAALKPKILEYVKKAGTVTMRDIYRDLKCDDIPMYLAIHDLVKEGALTGNSPYDSHLGSHDKYVYTVEESL